MEGQEQSMAHTIEFLDDLSLAAHDPSPPWQEFGDIAVNLEAHVWVQIAVRFSHPVKSLPRDAISASVGAIFPHDLPTYELLKRQKACERWWGFVENLLSSCLSALFRIRDRGS